ncbi:hypothetical protein ATB98_02405 [Sinorhizobium saheli]|uniref:Uncharacterized protein n=1 Tax=Sinorhizobium saheli TaxID=36856 RepID=A0A178XLP9_SINSA|nr:hypothetical protein ATB98_02405 [Sinorhizobium saheli]
MEADPFVGVGLGLSLIPLSTPSGLPAISPTRGENMRGLLLASLDSFCRRNPWIEAESVPRVVCPLVGEMAGRPEGVSKVTREGRWIG